MDLGGVVTDRGAFLLEPHRLLFREYKLYLLFGVCGSLCRPGKLPDVRDLLFRPAAEEESGNQQYAAGSRAGDPDDAPPERSVLPEGQRGRELRRGGDPFREAAVGCFGIETGVGQVFLSPCVVGVEIVAAMFLRGAEPVEKFGLLGIGETLAVEVACDQVVDMSVLHVHLFYSRISGPNPYLPG